MELCSHLAERALLHCNALKISEDCLVWARGAGTGIVSLAAATSRQLPVTLFRQSLGF